MDWATTIKLRLSDSALSESELERAGQAVQHLRSVFGEDLQALPQLVRRNLWNLAPWTHQWINWLSEALLHLKSSNGYRSLQKRIANRDQFMEAYSVVQVAERLNAAGFGVSVDTPVHIEGTRKVPDLQVYDEDTQSEFFVEVSVLFLSAQQSENAAALDHIIGLLLSVPPDIVYAGRLLRAVDGEEADGLIAHIAGVIRELPGAAAFREIFISDIVEAAVGHAAQAAAVAAWAARHGLQLGAFAGPASNVDLGLRFRRKVADKAKQLPPDLSNLLVIPAPELFFVVDEPRELLPLIRDTISDHSQIAMVIVASEESGYSAPTAIMVDGDHLMTSCRSGMVQRFLMVENRACATPLPAVVRKKICMAFAL